MSDGVIVVRPVQQRIVVRRPGPPGPNQLDFMTDVDLTGSVSGDLFGLLVSGKWGPITNVADLLTVDDAATTYVPQTVLGAAGGVATLDGGGKLTASQIPAISINDTFVAVDEAAMLALDAQKGDVAVRTDLSSTWILNGDDPTVLGNWIKLLTPPDAVLSVNGQAGVVQIDAPDVPFASTSGLASTDVAGALDEVHTGPAGGVLTGTYPNPGFAPSPSFVPSSSGAVGLLVTGVTGQTGDYLQAQDSLGNVLAQITYLGGVRATRFSSVATGKATLESNYDTGGLAVLTGSDSNKGLVIRRNSSSQSANIFETQLETGVVAVAINGSGQLSTGNRMIAGGSSPTSSAVHTVYTVAATNPGIIVRGVASQAADLFQAQDSAGTTVARIIPSGAVRSDTFQGLTNTKSFLQMNGDTGGILVQTQNDANKGLVVRRNSATQAANLLEVQDQAGVANAGFTQSFSLWGNRITAGQPTSGVSTASVLFVNTSGASNIGAIVKGAASQAANLQEWQDSSGAVKGSFAADGIWRGGAFASVITGKAALWTNYDTNGIGITTGADANKGLVLRASSGTQSANLFEAQDSAGVAVAAISPTGVMTTGSTISLLPGGAIGSSAFVMANSRSRFGYNGSSVLLDDNGTSKPILITTGAALTGPSVTITSGTASVAMLVVKGAASQSAQLQQWQDSAGVTKLAATVTGALFNGSTSAALRPALDTGAWGVTTESDSNKGLVIRQNSGTQSGSLLEFQTSAGSVITWVKNNGILGAQQGLAVGTSLSGLALPAGYATFLTLGSASAVAVGVRGAVSQTGNLQQWEDSAATILSQITNLGTYRGPGIASVTTGKASMNTNFDTGGLVIITGNDANKGLVIRRNSATQSATLFELQNEAGAVRSWFDANGNLHLRSGGNQSASLEVGTPGVSNIGLIVQGVASQSSDLQQWQSSAAAVLAGVSSTGRMFGAAISTINSFSYHNEENSGGYHRLTKQTAQAGTPLASQVKLYVRDGTTVGTLKLVVLGPGGVETTVIDNIA